MTSTAAVRRVEPLAFTIATERAEIEQVHQLNYRTFVEEIPQHDANPRRALVDRFHDDNTYFVARSGQRVVGMVAVRARRPFSIDDKLADLDRHLPAGLRVCEIRLLAVEPEYRNGVVFRGLVRELTRYCVGLGVNGAVISAAVRQLPLYTHMGFVPFGPRVGTARAPYQPMYITLDAFHAKAERAMQRRRAGARALVGFLPGPVDVHPDVRAAFHRPPVSHRDDAFLDDVRHTRRLLRHLTGAREVTLLLGSGTLANDVVAMQLAARAQPGLVLSNGEFGERLIDHAVRAGLRFDCERFAWGDALDAVTLAGIFTLHPSARWCWMVHHETSTGVLNDLPAAASLAREQGLRLCVDCISSVGVVPVDLRDVHLATAVSGKGLGSYAGVALVFHDGTCARTMRGPRYLDLSLYAAAEGVPFTQSSPLVGALRVAAERALTRRSSDAADLASFLRAKLRAAGFRLVAEDAAACPGIVTLALDEPDGARRMGDALSRAGFALSYRSGYLARRNWIQVALMGECSREKVELLLRAIANFRAASPTARSRRSEILEHPLAAVVSADGAADDGHDESHEETHTRAEKPADV